MTDCRQTHPMDHLPLMIQRVFWWSWTKCYIHRRRTLHHRGLCCGCTRELTDWLQTLEPVLSSSESASGDGGDK